MTNIPHKPSNKCPNNLNTQTNNPNNINNINNNSSNNINPNPNLKAKKDNSSKILII